MSAGNPYFAAQDRIRALIAGAPYFVTPPLAPGQIITEIPADLQYWTDQNLQALDFGVTIETAKGESDVSSYAALQERAEFVVSIVHNPQNDPAHNVLDALWAIVSAVHGQPVMYPPRSAPTDFDFFRVLGHLKVGTSDTKSVHELRIAAGLRLF